MKIATWIIGAVGVIVGTGNLAVAAVDDIPFSTTVAAGDIEDHFITIFSLTLPEEVGEVTSLQLDINGLTHTHPDDLTFFLVHPVRNSVLVMDERGDGFDVSGVNLSFSDDFTDTLPDADRIVSGDYALAAGNSFDRFLNLDGTGEWLLIAVEDSATNVGSVESITLSGTYVPEPMTLSLLALGALATLRHRRRRG